MRTGLLPVVLAGLCTALTGWGCAARSIPSPAERLETASIIAHAAGFTRAAPGAAVASDAAADGNALPIAVWVRPVLGDARARATAGRRVHVYIEGDGLAWRTRRRVSDDPTPVDPIGLRLAAQDPSDAKVLYLGRPCQYRPPSLPPCSARLWTSHRYAEVVVDALDRRIDALLGSDRANARPGSGGSNARLVLIGYSGGGVVAALLAARRDDVALLVTIAAPLDVERWTREAGVSPLTGSLTPMDALDALARVPQVHFVGAADRVVPLDATEGLVRSLPAAAERRMVVVERMDHDGWPACWTALARDEALFVETKSE